MIPTAIVVPIAQGHSIELKRIHFTVWTAIHVVNLVTVDSQATVAQTVYQDQCTMTQVLVVLAALLNVVMANLRFLDRLSQLVLHAIVHVTQHQLLAKMHV